MLQNLPHTKRRFRDRAGKVSSYSQKGKER